MAGFFQQFLQGAVDGFLGSPNLKDYRHASKTFITNGFQNTPKFKWLFHVYFGINKQFITNNPRVFPDTTNYGLMVKSIELPKYQVAVDELNQYNRKRYIQKKINYNPIRISFHDDNANQIRNLWYAYYSYYYNDPSQPQNPTANPQSRTPIGASATSLNNRNIYNNDISDQVNWGYLGEISTSNLSRETIQQKIPFFSSIKIFGFNQHNFALYELINPVIDSFNHDTYSYAETASTMENSMSIKYESVKYYDGALNGRNPGQVVEGFGDPATYDTELSPIARPGTNRTVFGQGGLVDSGIGILNDLSNGNVLGAVQTAGRVSRTFKNSQQILQSAKAELVAGAVSAVTNPQTVRSVFNFPSIGSNTGTLSQQTNSNNYPSTYAKPVNTPTNTTISGGPTGGP